MISTTDSAKTSAPSTLRAALAEDGYVLLPSTLSHEDLTRLRTAALSSTSLARDGKWPHIRTLPKAFPPWPSDPSSGIWGVQHLMNPALPQSGIFASSYFSPLILSTVCALLECKTSDLVMELYNLLVRPDEDFSLRWHRDDVPPTASASEEEEILGKEMRHAQWNLALFDDESLIVVPGSHKRARTETERSTGSFEEMQDQTIVKMKAGDVVFYNNNILHRGVYSSDKERMTLHGSMGVLGEDGARARNVLQHGPGEWVDRCDFSDLSGEVQGEKVAVVAERMRRALIEMAKVNTDVGYSQADE
ncbi:hypothetical protein MBLNU457_1809t1 [Dothideomycetes sp. NU457]